LYENEILSAKKVSSILNKSLKFVYTHAAELGGAKIGGSYIFTQEGLYDALQRKNHQQMETVQTLSRQLLLMV
jgi:hypothetical protein